MTQLMMVEQIQIFPHGTVLAENAISSVCKSVWVTLVLPLPLPLSLSLSLSLSLALTLSPIPNSLHWGTSKHRRGLGPFAQGFLQVDRGSNVLPFGWHLITTSHFTALLSTYKVLWTCKLQHSIYMCHVNCSLKSYMCELLCILPVLLCAMWLA